MSNLEFSHSKNTLSLTERDIYVPEDEKRVLASMAKERIDEIFDSLDHTEKITTLSPIELDAHPLSPPNELFQLLVKFPYARAHIDASFSNIATQQSLDLAHITLFMPGTPYSCNIYIGSDEDEDEESFDPEKPRHVFHLGAGNDTEASYIPLRTSDAKKLLAGLVAQGNEYRAITMSSPSIKDSVNALLEVCPDTSTDKYIEYCEGSTASNVAVMLQKSVNVNTKDGSAHREESCTAVVIERSTQDECDTELTGTLDMNQDGVATRISAEYASEDHAARDIRHDKMQEDLHDFHSTTETIPGRFTSQIINGIELIHRYIK